MIGPIPLPTDAKALAKGFIYKEDEAEKIIAFAQKYFTSQFRNPPFKLQEWQSSILKMLYGWRHEYSNVRRFRTLILSMAKVLPPDCKDQGARPIEEKW